jgi:S-adenosylmethionine synthetase
MLDTVTMRFKLNTITESILPPEYTVESVTPGHPDKICDQISDAILDAYLADDPAARVAVEVMGSHGTLVIGGEVTSKAEVDAAAIAKQVYRDIGYDDELEVLVRIAKQSPEIGQSVDSGGAGDQGIMYGYATDETDEMLPRGVVFAHEITRQLERVRRSGGVSWLLPDGKAQVTIQRPHAATVVVSTQHAPGVHAEDRTSAMLQYVVNPALGGDAPSEVLVNTAGDWTVGGFAADAGMTGRKIMVDTYGGLVPHGGGCFSGKDPTKVDRSAAYMARFAARQLVAQGVGHEVLVSVAYAIGKAEPLMLRAVNEKNKDCSSELAQFDFRPAAIIERLELRRPIYRETAKHGHFENAAFPWEKTERQ